MLHSINIQNPDGCIVISSMCVHVCMRVCVCMYLCMYVYVCVRVVIYNMSDDMEHMFAF